MSRKRNGVIGQTMFVFVMTMIVALFVLGTYAQADDGSIIKRFHTVSTVSTTVPSNGDTNPYGVAEVKRSVGNLVKGHILVSNFNNSAGQEGTGTTIVDITPGVNSAPALVFSQITNANLPGPCPGGIGLTTALVVLDSGWVIVGSVPTTDGLPRTVGNGCLIVIDSLGNPVETFYGSLLNGPWDMTKLEDRHGVKLFVSTVLNGITTQTPLNTPVNEGQVVRINLTLPPGGIPSIESMTVIGSGFPEFTNNTVLVVGPTGVGLSPQNGYSQDQNGHSQESVLYVADTANNRIAVIPDAVDRTTSAGLGLTLTSGGSLNGPLGLTVAPNGHILTVNGGDGNIVETTPQGRQIARFTLDNTPVPPLPPGNGTLFGLTFDPIKGVFFVDNGTNTLNLFH